MRGSNDIEVEKFVNYLASSEDLKFSKTALRRFKKEATIKHIVEGFQTYDESTSKLPPSRRGIKLASKDKKIAERLGLSQQTMIDEIIKEKYEIFQANKKIIRENINPMLSDFKRFSSKKLEQKLAYKYASTKGKQQMTYKKDFNFSRNSKLGKALRDTGIPYRGFDKDKITLGYNQELSNKLYENNMLQYTKKGEKPPSPPPIKEAIYDVWYDGVDTGIKIKTTDIEQLFSNTTKRAYEVL